MYDNKKTNLVYVRDKATKVERFVTKRALELRKSDYEVIDAPAEVLAVLAEKPKKSAEDAGASKKIGRPAKQVEA